ncbi:MAG: MBL fold metallo-hydrolase [Chloroflexi bacterium]|nr:MBL fold metallo-hydrolase [Chloroflexota bacterium]
MTVTLDWLGCATFRLTVDELVIYLDAYMDRVPSAPAVGLTTSEVDRADYVLIGHSHFDHLVGAETIAANTGAKIIGSNETARVMLDEGIPQEQLWRAQGGEHFRLSDKVTVRVFPSLHSCIWTSGSNDPGQVVLGDYGLTEDERWPPDRTPRMLEGLDPRGLEEMQNHMGAAVRSDVDGGALAYVIETPEGSIFYHDTSGCWSRVISDLRPDVALIGMAGRPNIDGEPIQGSLAQFVGRMANMLRPRQLFLGHHDNWMPPMTQDMTTEDALAPVREELSRVEPRTKHINVGYMEGTRLFR